MNVVKILFVEDDDMIRLVTAEFLQAAGFDVSEATNGDEAAELLGDPLFDVDVLFTDVSMPGSRDGVDVALHARRGRPHIPVLMVSADALNMEWRLGAFEPAIIFMSKPYDLYAIAASLTLLAGGSDVSDPITPRAKASLLT